MHPLQSDITGLSDQDLENKITELTKKYFQALRFSPGAANQIVLMLDGFKWEQQRRSVAKSKERSDAVSEFDDLIKID